MNVGISPIYQEKQNAEGVSPALLFLTGYDREAPLGLEVREETVRAGYREVSLTYLSSGPVRVPAVLTAPATVATGAAVLVQHGGGESKDSPLVRLLLRRWAASGLTCLAIDAPGHGERSVPGTPGGRRGFFEYLRSRLQNVVDLRRGLDVLIDEVGADGDRIAYWGVSMGGGVGVMLLAADARVRAACLCLAGLRARRSWPEVPPALAAFAANNLDPAAVAPRLSGREVLLLNGEEDRTVTREEAERLFEALPGPKEQRWFRAGHKVTPAMLRASRGFLRRVLDA